MNTTGLEYKKMIERIQINLETYIIENNLQSLVLGISGGIDSALCAAIARPVCDKLEIPLIGRSIPILTNSLDETNRANLIGKAFCTNFDGDYQMSGIFRQLWSVLKPEGWDREEEKEDFRMGNIKARLRMIFLYDLAQLYNGMVLSTDNYTEYLLGFWTLHGDVGDYGMVQNLWKTEVYNMAEYLATSLTGDQAHSLFLCITADATDGLGISKTDLDQIMPEWKGNSRDGYKEVDKILFSYLIGVKEINDNPIEEHPVIKRHLATEFKRNNPYNIPRNRIL